MAAMAEEKVANRRESFTLPRPGTKFSKTVVERILQDVCNELIGDRPYVFDEVQPLIKELCSEIQQRVLRTGLDRYKMVTHVSIMEAAQQGVRVASRCLWDPETDNYASYTHSTEQMHVSILTFALFWE